MAQAQVLVACSDSENRRSLTDIVTQLGLKPIPASTVSEAQDVLSQHPVCLVFCEDNLPEGGYREFLNRTKLVGLQIPLVVSSSLGGEERYLEAMRLGVFEYISPPYVTAEIESIVDRRRETRLSARLPLQVFGADVDRVPFLQFAWTRNISANGAQLDGIVAELRPGDVVGVKCHDRSALFRVIWVHEPEAPSKERRIGISILDPGHRIWGLGHDQ
jgi:CheY-like chemotaxis protein